MLQHIWTEMYSFGPIPIRAYVDLNKLFESNWIHLPILNSLIFRIYIILTSVTFLDILYLWDFIPDIKDQ